MLSFKKLLPLLMILLLAISIFFAPTAASQQIPLIAIANYGPHHSLDEAIIGLKERLHSQGYIEGKNVRYTQLDVGFDPALIPQMLSSLQAQHPAVIVVLTTPVAQVAKAKIKSIPLVYTVITDPQEAQLTGPSAGSARMIGSSDRQDTTAMLSFVRSMIPDAQRVGLLYATSESNDAALVKMMQQSTQDLGMSLMALPIEQARDVPVRIEEFKDKVDFIYVGTSGPIQPTLPAIAAAAKKMRIPVFNADSAAVVDGLALASFGVDYQAVGSNTADLVIALLQGVPQDELASTFPAASDHQAVVNRQLAKFYGALIPLDATIVG